MGNKGIQQLNLIMELLVKPSEQFKDEISSDPVDGCFSVLYLLCGYWGVGLNERCFQIESAGEFCAAQFVAQNHDVGESSRSFQLASGMTIEFPVSLCMELVGRPLDGTTPCQAQAPPRTYKSVFAIL